MDILIHRTTEYDLVLTAHAGQGACLKEIVDEFKRQGARAWKLGQRTYQVSLDGHPEMRADLPAIGTQYVVQV